MIYSAALSPVQEFAIDDVLSSMIHHFIDEVSHLFP